MHDTEFTEQCLQNKAITSAGQAIDNVLQQTNGGELEDMPSVTCQVCGRTVYFSNNQWRKACPQCCTFITLRRPREEVVKRYFKCWICLDRGYVTYQAQDGDNLYDYASRCTCDAGQKKYSGMPAIDVVSNAPAISTLIARNRKDFLGTAAIF